MDDWWQDQTRITESITLTHAQQHCHDYSAESGLGREVWLAAPWQSADGCFQI